MEGIGIERRTILADVFDLWDGESAAQVGYVEVVWWKTFDRAA
jgi:hypothetical protein